MTDEIVLHNRQGGIVKSMSAFQFLRSYESQGAKPAYVRGAKSFLVYCFQYGLPINLPSVEMYSFGKSPTAKTFAKKCCLFFESLQIPNLLDDLSASHPPQYHVAIEAFLKGSPKINSSETRGTYASTLNKYFTYCFRNQLPLFSSASTIAYKSSLIADNLSAAYINNALSSLRSMARYILDNRDEIKGIGKEEADNLKNVLLVMNVPVKSKTYKKATLDIQERKYYLSVIPNLEDKLQMSLMAYEGLRRGEITRIRKEDIDLQEGIIYVRGKGYINDPVPVKMFSVSIAIALQYIKSKPNGNLFPELKKEMVSAKAKAYFEEAGIHKNGLTAHSLRHTALQLLTDAGTPLELVQKQARHSSPSTTQIYVQKAIDRKYLRDIMKYEQ